MALFGNSSNNLFGQQSSGSTGTHSIFGSDGSFTTVMGNGPTAYTSKGTLFTRAGNTVVSSTGKVLTKTPTGYIDSDGTVYTQVGNSLFGTNGTWYSSF